jgi:hypothetical protein
LAVPGTEQRAVLHPAHSNKKARNEHTCPFKFRAFRSLASGRQSTAKVFFGAISPRSAREEIAFVRVAEGSKKNRALPASTTKQPGYLRDSRELKK